MNRVHPHLSKGYAYVEFETPEEAEKALKHMDGGKRMQRNMTMEMAQAGWQPCCLWLHNVVKITDCSVITMFLWRTCWCWCLTLLKCFAFQVKSMVRRSRSQLCWHPQCALPPAGCPLPAGCLLHHPCGDALHLEWGEGEQDLMSRKAVLWFWKQIMKTIPQLLLCILLQPPFLLLVAMTSNSLWLFSAFSASLFLRLILLSFFLS